MAALDVAGFDPDAGRAARRPCFARSCARISPISIRISVLV
jgi:hypothetical protein